MPYSNPYRKPNWFKRIIVTSILLIFAAWSGLTALHYSKGAIFSDAVAMTGDDMRVIMSCTEDIDTITDFITRDDTTPLTSGLQGNSTAGVVDEICKGDIVSARTLSNRYREQARVARLNTPNTPSSPPQRNIFTPTPSSNTGTPPNIPSPPGVAVVSISEPSPTPESSSNQSGFEFFKSTRELTQSAGETQPTINIRELEKLVHDLTNRERNQQSRGSLMYEDEIADIARNHSLDMVRNDYFSHNNLSGEDSTDRGANVGYDCIKTYADHYTYGLAENIHQGWLFSSTTYINEVPFRDWSTQEQIAETAVNGWMDSEGHRENILDATYDREGIGVAIAEDGKVYITANFC